VALSPSGHNTDLAIHQSDVGHLLRDTLTVSVFV
jgi:hypothetical protein